MTRLLKTPESEFLKYISYWIKHVQKAYFNILSCIEREIKHNISWSYISVYIWICIGIWKSIYKSLLIKRNHQVFIFKVHDNILTRSKCGCKSKYLLRNYSFFFFFKFFWSGSVVSTNPILYLWIYLLVSKEKVKVWVSDFVL